MIGDDVDDGKDKFVSWLAKSERPKEASIA